MRVTPEIPREAASLPYPKRGLITVVLVAPFAANVKFCKEISDYLDIGDDLIDRLPMDKRAVVWGCFDLTHEKRVLADGEMRIEEITKLAGEILEARAENFKLTPARVGRILAALGVLGHRRRCYGYVIPVDRDTIEVFHKLARLYGVSSPDPYSPWDPTPECKWCRKLRLFSEEKARRFKRRKEAEEKHRAKEAPTKYAAWIKSRPIRLVPDEDKEK